MVRLSQLHSGLTPELGTLTLDEHRSNLKSVAHLSSRQLGNGVAPVKLEDRFDNLKEDSEEEKQQNSSLVFTHADNGREFSFDEHPLKHRPNILQLARER